MKTKLLLLMVVTGVCFAQTSKTKPNPTNTQILNFILDFQEKRIIEVAEAMPAEKYHFAPTAGEFKGVRTFAEQLKHIAADNYLLGAGILGENPPRDVGDDERGSTSVKTKQQIIAYLKDSFAYMHRAAAAIDDEKSPIPTPHISPWPNGSATRLGVAIEDALHTWDHYGQLVEYLRMNDILPPASGKAANDRPSQTGTTMPEEKYSFTPTGSGFTGVRTFGEQVKHLAANNYSARRNLAVVGASSWMGILSGRNCVRPQYGCRRRPSRKRLCRSPAELHECICRHTCRDCRHSYGEVPVQRGPEGFAGNDDRVCSRSADRRP